MGTQAGQGRPIGYPMDHVLAVFDDPTEAATAAAAMVRAGIPERDISILRGEEGARRLDGSGGAGGRLGRTRRIVAFTLMDQSPDLAWYEAAVRAGGAVLMVRVRGEARKRTVVTAIRDAGGHFANLYGRFATEELLRWRGPDPEVHDLLKR